MWIVYLAVGVACVAALATVCFFAARLLWSSGRLGKLLVALALLALGPTLYRAAVPPASAYRDEFSRLSGLALPASAEVVDRSATFPDFHGYRACMLVRLAPADAAALQRRLLIALSPAPLGPCGMAGRVSGPGTAMRYRVTHREERDEASMTIAVDPVRGLLKAEWQIRRRLGGG